VTATVHLDPASVEALARRVVELLHGEDVAGGMIDAGEAARRLGVSRDFVYTHRIELGGVKIGEGPKARLRFDPAVIAERLASDEPKSEPAKPTRRMARREAASVELLPIAGRERR
jgi:hypothetical protein